MAWFQLPMSKLKHDTRVIDCFLPSCYNEFEIMYVENIVNLGTKPWYAKWILHSL